MPHLPMPVSARHLLSEVISVLPYVPLDSQKYLLSSLCNFATGEGDENIFLLNGYAGTGKTSLTGAFVKTLHKYGFKTVLLAPTGRAAKVFSNFAGQRAYTIHKRLFRLKGNDPMHPSFVLAPNKDKNTLFIVDEASMVSDSEAGSLLLQLLQHVYSGENCRLILIGDNAQLPPVGQSDSPAMNVDRLRNLGLRPKACELFYPVRQAVQSGILYNATLVRKMMEAETAEFPTLAVKDFPDVEVVSRRDLEDALTSSWSRVGESETLIITRSNYRANLINHDVRCRIMYAESVMERGEQILVTKNNYYWSRTNPEMPFIANGETAVVEWIGHEESKYGFHFVDVELRFPGVPAPIATKVLIESISSDMGALSTDDMNRLYANALFAVEEDSKDRYAGLKADPYVNALQVKHAYCVTCHKAQGGQWKHIYVDLDGIRPDALENDFLRWLYTAITRATEKIFFIQPSIPTDIDE